ncbi:hypothetical protein SPSYN_00818 [Sporotomaculum syntrophicum]|uniref:Microcin J25-processing protein McjB C-terminal domain-containing protein n=1 Tax=Sporotomaculum syntrophicum TaxID=182264 RepID=A0A9D3AWZ1_9FIRM|nr:lasso peptide biosynthesis B2 protein [Sporotomaculum syntrophicum]KAF1086080.1 hypothetical protein SPSYN_00818 [Sporotomaculum syntrophicum]
MSKGLLILLRRTLKFVLLPLQEQWLYLQAFVLAGVVRLAIILLPFRWLAGFLGNQELESPAEEDHEKLNAARRVGRVVETVCRHTPWESKCLVQAIVGKILLRQSRISNTLYLGVGRDPEDKMVAHAWLRCGDMILTGNYNLDKYAVVGKFTDGGLDNE